MIKSKVDIARGTTAAGLANSTAKPRVLLLEAGDNKEDRNLRVDGQRWTLYTPKLMELDPPMHRPRL
jgi:hypothetical protein